MENSHNDSTSINTSMLSSIQTLLRRAGPATDPGGMQSVGRKAVIRLLNEALATELVSVLRYKRQATEGIETGGNPAKMSFLAYAERAMLHADRLAKRIIELGGHPEVSPERLRVRSHSEYHYGNSLRAMLVDDLRAEQAAIAGYREIADFLADHDAETCRLLADVLLAEEQRVTAIAGQLADLFDRAA
jgi:bacterioferritin